MIRALTLCLLGTMLATPSWAARPFITDDARLTTEGSCQLESWTRIYPDSKEFWAMPACNPTGNLEFTLGSGIAKNNGESTTHDYVLQLKTLFKPLETNGWGIGLAIGKIRHPAIIPGPNNLGNTYAYIPLSTSFQDDKIVMHINLGWQHDHASDQDSMTWGVGGEFQLLPRLTAIAETFGDNRTQPYWQTGLRFTIVPDLFQMDTTIGQQVKSGSDGQWVSFGIRLTPDHLF